MQWVAKPQANEDLANELVASLGAPKVIANILCQRGLDSTNKVKTFFNPKITDLHDPFLMKDMDKAIERIQKSIEDNENVMIYGDYDVDGTTSVALVYSFFKEYFSHCEFYIPDRYKEGYGISKAGIDYAKEQSIQLIIALDCGIQSTELVLYAKELGIDFIICDHHLPGAELPNAVAVLDPKREDCEYPFKELSGCGIGFKLCEAYAQVNDLDERSYLQYLDLLALSIAADIVPVTGENRVLAHFGLKVVNQQPSLGIKALSQLAVSKSEMSIGDLVFYISPRINAAGRLGHASLAVELLIEKEESKAFEIANKLHAQNAERRSIDQQITEDLKSIVEDNPALLEKKSLVFYKEDWHKGVIGIAASRSVDLFYKPTIILTKSNGVLTGSARSVVGYDVHQALVECKNHLLQFGGHKYAAGLSLDVSNLQSFTEAFESAAQKLTDEDLTPKLFYDQELDMNVIDDKLLSIIQKMGPFGPGNQQPVFRANKLKEDGWAKVIGKTGEHLRLSLERDTQKIAAIGFGLASKLPSIQKADTFDACFQIQENVFRGERSLQLMLKDLRPSTYDSGNDAS
ncbi:MAG: single-stranded-DNA-specific exonuclease RecJ [Bacteroidia bacterium]